MRPAAVTIALGLCTLLPCHALGSVPPGVLVSRTLGPSALLNDVQTLTDDLGGRPSGSPALERAERWAQKRFVDAGLENVRLEPYLAPRLWLAQRETGQLLAPIASALRVVALPMSSGTPKEGLEAEVADVGNGDDAGFSAAGALQHRWVLVHTSPMKSLDDLFKEYLATPRLVERVQRAGAAGVLWMSNRPGHLLYRHDATLDGSLFPLPAAMVEREAGLRMARWISEKKSVRVKLVLESVAPAPAQERNVVAEVRGKTLPNEVVILGAHLDSWDLGQGALDNGCNVGLVLEAARELARLAREGLRPKRTIRFVLYTGEEQSLWGSFAEVRAHRAMLDQVKAQIVFDAGSGRTTGFSLGGRKDLKPTVDAALAPLSGLGPFEQTTDAFIGTDNYDYLVEGVPTLVANQDGAPYLPDYHAESDTFDKVDTRELHLNTAVASVLAWSLADSDAPLPGRQSRAEVEALVKATGLDQQMKAFHLWEPFLSGARGRAP